MAMTSPDPLPVICDGLPSQREVTAGSSSTLAGSCTAHGRRHGESAALNATSSPEARTVPVSSAPPACATAVLPNVSTRYRGWQPIVCFTWRRSSTRMLCPFV